MKCLITKLVHTDPLSAVQRLPGFNKFPITDIQVPESMALLTACLDTHSMPRSSLNGEFSVPGAVHAPTSYCTLTWFLPDKISLILHISTLHGFQIPSRNQSTLLKFTRKTILLYG